MFEVGIILMALLYIIAVVIALAIGAIEMGVFTCIMLVLAFLVVLLGYTSMLDEPIAYCCSLCIDDEMIQY